MNQYFVDVRRGNLQLTVAALRQLTGLLADDEMARANAFKSPVLRDRFIAVRGLLRQTLARYLGVDPAGLGFESGEHGKPALAGGGLHFNLSHTVDTLLIAVADIADIGIDIEAIHSRRNVDGLAQRCFSEREYQGWRQLPLDGRLEAFYRLWTKKEAFVKAVGRGIALGVERCEIELDSGGQLLAIPSEYGPANVWKVHELECGADFSAALVTPNCRYDLRCLALEAD